MKIITKRQSFFVLLLLFLSIAQADSTTAAVATELLRDRHFEHGFCVISPTHGTRIVEGYLNWDGQTRPVWDLGQWHSKYSIFNAEVETLSEGVKKFANPTKSITVCSPGGSQSDLIMMLDSRTEFECKFRKDGQPWPHLLVEQRVADCPAMAEMKKLQFHIEARLLEDDCDRSEGYKESLHTAQMPFVIVVQNYSKSSSGCGDFGWFIIPLYDSRFRDWPVFIAQDQADPSSKMIYNPGAKALGIESLHNGDWVTIDIDVLPMLLEGMKEAWKRGYLGDSQDLKDYRISSINMGWEVTGLAKASMQVRNLSMKATTEAKVK